LTKNKANTLYKQINAIDYDFNPLYMLDIEINDFNSLLDIEINDFNKINVVKTYEFDEFRLH
jgi:hypothetical protein